MYQFPSATITQNPRYTYIHIFIPFAKTGKWKTHVFSNHRQGFECYTLSLGGFPGVWILYADISEQAVQSSYVVCTTQDGTDSVFRNFPLWICFVSADMIHTHVTVSWHSVIIRIARKLLKVWYDIMVFILPNATDLRTSQIVHSTRYWGYYIVNAMRKTCRSIKHFDYENLMQSLNRKYWMDH